MCKLQVIVLLLIACATTSGQSIDAELVRLRELLNVPPSTKIVPSTAALPNINRLKVYVATGDDKDLNKVFVRRLDEWNKKNGPKYGIVEVVFDISEAQIVLRGIRFKSTS